MSKPILLLNCGSSSIKYQVIDGDTEAVVATGLVQKIGDATPGTIDHTVNGKTHRLTQHFADHTEALHRMVQLFGEHGPKLSEVVAVGHRTVHGGDKFSSTVKIDAQVLDTLRQLSPLAPLHNPPAIAGIEAARDGLPFVPHVAIFDTAFFATLPAEAYTYAIDRDLAKEHSIRKYGFHGTSHSYVSKAAAKFVGKPYNELNQIVAHLGNGASISAIRGGEAVEASMGMTPLAGLVMGTRSGDVDPGLHAFLARSVGMDIDAIDTMLNKKSGLQGMSGVTDFRDLAKLIDEGDAAAILAFDVYIHRLLSYIGSYLAVLGHVDVLSFTAGAGENNVELREKVIKRLEPLGFVLDAEANQIRSKEPRRISTSDSPVTVLVVPTNEELAMAREVVAAIS